MKLLRKILFPIVPLYYGVTWVRNYCFDKGVFKSKSYNFPVICVGNLSVGGTGKTPMIEYFVALLKENYKVAILSRGYKRTSDGFQIADKSSSAVTIGDEPFQFYQKFDDILVSVDNDRQNGIAELRKVSPKPDIILLDDAFQHRKVKAGFNILLTTYDKPYTQDFVLPAGNLRESTSGAKRADIIVVTKCPGDLNDIEKAEIINQLKPLSDQDVFFSSIEYSKFIYSKEFNKPISNLKNKKFTLVTGIADATPLLNYLKREGFDFEHLNFKDHHKFTKAEMQLLNTKDLILTTEKDFTRLKDGIATNKLYYLPIVVNILEEEKFNTIIKQFISSY